MVKFSRAIWDTGASKSVITQSVVEKLGLSPIDHAVVHNVNGKRSSGVYLVNIGLPNKMIIPSVQVTDGDIFGADALIGMDVTCLGDFAITNKDKQTMMTFEIPSTRRYDFVEQINQSIKASKNRSNHRTRKRKKR